MNGSMAGSRRRATPERAFEAPGTIERVLVDLAIEYALTCQRAIDELAARGHDVAHLDEKARTTPRQDARRRPD